MKKTLTLAAALVASAAFAQVSVTYKVDITDYLGGGATLGANGMRIGGNFAAQGATAGTNAMVDWSPSNQYSAMTAEANNVWSITVNYPASAVGATQLYKFVNNDWGTNEGTAGTTIATDNCGVDDGGGNINRTLVIPSANAAFLFCYDRCFQCDGSSPALTSEELEVAALTVAPNPTAGNVNVTFSARAAGTATVKVMNLLGQSVMVLDRAVEAGVNTINADLNVANGTYFVEVAVDGVKSVKRVVVAH
ncbi:MAG: T9SS type A sorting domain-containing protein [Bacteroidetes bacterium]|nr:T9SS type A sorting domain-containing protein [Bacteroidota bacterium]